MVSSSSYGAMVGNFWNGGRVAHCRKCHPGFAGAAGPPDIEVLATRHGPCHSQVAAISAAGEEAMTDATPEMIQRKVDALSRSLDRQSNEIKEHFVEIRDWAGHAFGELKSEMKTGFARIDGLESEMKTGFARINGLESEMKTGFARIDGLESEMKTGFARVDRLETEMKTG